MPANSRPRSRPREIECAAFHERLDRLLVDVAVHDALAEIHQALEGAVGFAFADQRLDGARADALDAGQAVANRAFDGREAQAALVDVRRQHLDAHLLRLGHQHRQLVGVADFGRQHRRHEFDGMVRLQIGRLEGHDAVGGRMRLVEAVGREFAKSGRRSARPWPRCTSSSSRSHRRTPGAAWPSLRASSCPSRGAGCRPAPC